MCFIWSSYDTCPVLWIGFHVIAIYTSFNLQLILKREINREHPHAFGRPASFVGFSVKGVLMGSSLRLLSPADLGSSRSDKCQWDSLSQWLQSAATQQGLAGPISCSNRSPNSLMCHLLRSHAPNWLEFFFPVAEAIWDGLMSSERSAWASREQLQNERSSFGPIC